MSRLRPIWPRSRSGIRAPVVLRPVPVLCPFGQVVSVRERAKVVLVNPRHCADHPLLTPQRIEEWDTSTLPLAVISRDLLSPSIVFRLGGKNCHHSARPEME